MHWRDDGTAYTSFTIYVYHINTISQHNVYGRRTVVVGVLSSITRSDIPVCAVNYGSKINMIRDLLISIELMPNKTEYEGGTKYIFN